MLSNSMIPRALRPGPSTGSTLPGSCDESDTPITDETENDDVRSVVNGIERVNLNSHHQDDAMKGRSRSHRHHGALKVKRDAYIDYTNKTLAPEQTDFMIQQLERKADLRLKRTYSNGLPLDEVVQSAPVLSVALKFLPGADKPQVTRTEQIDMEGKSADQKDALWRVDTAGSLLSQYSVSPDLQIVKSDQTSNIIARVQHQRRDNDRGFPDQRRAATLRRRDDDTVTIDSDRVEIVKDLRYGNWHMKGLLVEVDWSSLWDLIVNYRSLIAKGGPEMTFEETRTLLETMIEDARRLCIRSPILFRMSTRLSIMNSEHTRYGINHGPMFKTLTTSKGIKEIISLSAAYYNSLDPTGADDLTQKYIRPRFLQMIVLLLSLLNNEDLAELKDFLEATYKLKADRRDIELLILKVIPLSSINSRVFLNALVPAIEGFPPTSEGSNKDEDHGHIWNVFVKRLLETGYLLPGTVEDLGREPLSWIVKWPEDGFKSTLIFNSLQYMGRLRTINDIPPVEVHPGSNCTELTVVMTDDSKHVISPKDLDNIIFMSPGTYPIQETAGGGRFHDLSIQETLLNGELYEAVKMTNDVVYKVNQLLAGPKRGSRVMSRLVRQRSDQYFLNDFRASGRLMEVVASLKQTTLAVTYKVEGRKVSRVDAVQNMARDIRRLRAFVGHIEHRGDVNDHGFFSGEKRELRQRLEQVKGQINMAEQRRATIGIDEELSNEPIAQCLYPEGANVGDPDLWNGYKAWCEPSAGRLNVEANISTVVNVRWLTSELLELCLNRQPSKVFATPLIEVPEGYRDDEAKIGDIAVLLGKYVALGERASRDSRSSDAYSMTNYLRIVSMENQNISRRGRNRVEESEGRSSCSFR